MTKYLCIIFITIFLLQIKIAFAICNGRIFNPITDVCWSCIFPISIGATPVIPNKIADTPNTSTIPCVCPGKILGLPQIGIPVGFWEGIELYEMSKEPFCFVSLGGISMPMQIFTGTGSQSINGRSGRYENWHLHKYAMPIFKLLSIVFDALCLEISSFISPFDIGYMTELDPLWMDDELTFVLNPEAVIFNNIIAQSACVADCVASTTRLPMDSLFWCGGCQGSIYPLTGNIHADYGSVQTTLLTMERFVAKMHRELQMWNTSGPESLCQPVPAPIIKKSQYRTQMTYPVPMNSSGLTNGCQPMGRSNALYDSGKEIPIKGENFGYLLWRKRNCCTL